MPIQITHADIDGTLQRVVDAQLERTPSSNVTKTGLATSILRRAIDIGFDPDNPHEFDALRVMPGFVADRLGSRSGRTRERLTKG